MLVIVLGAFQAKAAVQGEDAPGQSGIDAPATARDATEQSRRGGKPNGSPAHVSAMTFERRNAALDEIILARRSIREFRPESPGREAVMQVITAGMHAPYVLAAVETYSEGSFRRFFVMGRDGSSIATASARLSLKVKQLKAELEERAGRDAAFKAKSASWIQRLTMFDSLGHVPGVTNAPYFIVIAERRGIPDLGRQALAHCLENMWLKATALGLAFQIVSVTEKMGEDAEFCALLGVRPGEWDLMGCALGYAKEPLGPSQRPSAAAATIWLK